MSDNIIISQPVSQAVLIIMKLEIYFAVLSDIIRYPSASIDGLCLCAQLTGTL